MAHVRKHTYVEYAWPRAFARLYRSNALTTGAATAFAIIGFLLVSIFAPNGFHDDSLHGNFYAVIPHHTLVTLFGIVFAFALLALAIGTVHFWRDVKPRTIPTGAGLEATRNALTVKYLDGGHGDGCNDEDDRFTLRRRRFHHLTFYGFALCFASTSVATVYHYVLGRPAPYSFLSLPVMLGTLGGIGLLIGPAGLLWLNLHRAPDHGDSAQQSMDRAFISLLFFTSLTGLVLLAGRGTSYMPLLLAVHLGFVMAFFLTLPYGKFVHAFYRCAALLKASAEHRLVNRPDLGAN